VIIVAEPPGDVLLLALARAAAAQYQQPSAQRALLAFYFLWHVLTSPSNYEEQLQPQLEYWASCVHDK